MNDDQEIRSYLINVDERIAWFTITRKRPNTGLWSLPTTLMSLYPKHSQLWSGWLLPQNSILSHHEGFRFFYSV